MALSPRRTGSIFHGLIALMKIRPFFLLALLASATALAADPAPDAGSAPGDAEKNAVAELAKLGIDARPIAAGINWRAASVRLSTTKPDPKIFTLLKEVANLVELVRTEVTRTIFFTMPRISS